MAGQQDLPASLSEPSRTGTVVVAAADEHTRTGLLKTLGRLPWPVRPVKGPAAAVHEVNNLSRCGCVVLASFNRGSRDADKLAVRLAAYPNGSNYLIYILDDHDPATIAAAFEAGADDVVTRPLLESEVRARLEHAWQFLELQRLRERIGVQGALMAEMASAAVVHSRNYLDNELAKELERSRRYGHPLAVIMAEPAIPYGPAEGALRAAGRQLLELVRKDIDWVARLDGRRFAVVLPETGVRSASAAARRLSRKLRKADLEASGIPNETTWQFGVSAFDRISTPEAPPVDALLNASREYLDASRRHGPNSVAGGAANIRGGVVL